MKLRSRCLSSALLIAILCPVLRAQTPSFPGAEGYGATTTGGRGKPVIAVTNLQDDGPGSFRDAAQKSDATIVFKVNGVVHLKSALQLGSNLTIAGQTAPGSGITIADNKVTMLDSTNIVIRYMRFRGGIAESKGSSSLNLSNASHVMLDHLSIEWGRWDNIQTNGNSYTTIQNSIIGEGILPQRFGCLCQSDYLTLSHNLWVHNKSRNPKGDGRIQYVNNIVYDWGVVGYVGGHSSEIHYADLIGNYFIKGPSDKFIGEFTGTDHIYQAGNFVDLDRNGKLDGRLVSRADFDQVGATIMAEPFAKPDIPVRAEAADRIVREIVNDAGDSLCRDAVDTKMVNDLLSFGFKGHLIDEEKDAGGHPPSTSGKVELDSDGDGIPDTWEEAHHLDPHDPGNASKIDTETGYTYLELYLSEMAHRPATSCAAAS